MHANESKLVSKDKVYAWMLNGRSQVFTWNTVTPMDSNSLRRCSLEGLVYGLTGRT